MTALSATVAVLVVVAAAGRLGPPGAMLLAGPLGVVVLLVLARGAGMTADDLGIGHRSWRRGAAYALVCVSAVAVGYVMAALIPATRPAFLDTRYRNGFGEAVRAALLVVPIGTVLFEEVAFRGVLWGLVCRRAGATRATLVSSGVFGLWHVLPSLRLNRVNPAVAQLVGPGRFGQFLAVAGAVVFTTAAGAVLCELRRRSGSLLAPAGLHWAVNGLAILTAAGVVGWWEKAVPR